MSAEPTLLDSHRSFAVSDTTPINYGDKFRFVNINTNRFLALASAFFGNGDKENHPLSTDLYASSVDPAQANDLYINTSWVIEPPDTKPMVISGSSDDPEDDSTFEEFQQRESTKPLQNGSTFVLRLESSISSYLSLSHLPSSSSSIAGSSASTSGVPTSSSPTNSKDTAVISSTPLVWQVYLYPEELSDGIWTRSTPFRLIPKSNSFPALNLGIFSTLQPPVLVDNTNSAIWIHYDRNQPKFVRFYDFISCKHLNTGVYLHSDDVSYNHEKSSKNNRVVGCNGAGSGHSPLNDEWQVLPNFAAAGTAQQRLDVVENGSIIRLQNKLTKKFLHSQTEFKSPVTQQVEVSCCGESSVGDDWQLQILGNYHFLASNVPFRLIHLNTRNSLHCDSKAAQLPATSGSLFFEISCFSNRSSDDSFVCIPSASTGYFMQRLTSTIPTYLEGILHDLTEIPRDVSSTLKRPKSHVTEPLTPIPIGITAPGSKVTRIISDIHLYSKWFSEKDQQQLKSLLLLLDDIIQSKNVERLILLGDIAETWSIDPRQKPLTRKKIFSSDLVSTVVGRIRKILDKKVEVLYVIGNHDNRITKQDIDSELWDDRIQFVTSWNHLRYPSITCEHGNRFDLHNSMEWKKILDKTNTPYKKPQFLTSILSLLLIQSDQFMPAPESSGSISEELDEELKKYPVGYYLCRMDALLNCGSDLDPSVFKVLATSLFEKFMGVMTAFDKVGRMLFFLLAPLIFIFVQYKSKIPNEFVFRFSSSLSARIDQVLVALERNYTPWIKTIYKTESYNIYMKAIWPGKPENCVRQAHTDKRVIIYGHTHEPMVIPICSTGNTVKHLVCYYANTGSWGIAPMEFCSWIDLVDYSNECVDIVLKKFTPTNNVEIFGYQRLMPEFLNAPRKNKKVSK